jgi:hypothetical protein
MNGKHIWDPIIGTYPQVFANKNFKWKEVIDLFPTQPP